MAEKFKQLTKEGTGLYQVPNTIRLTTGVCKASINGIFYDGICWNKMYLLKFDEEFSFESVYAFLRSCDIHYQIRIDMKYCKYYIVLFVKNNTFEQAKTTFSVYERKLSEVLQYYSAGLQVVDGNERFRLAHTIVKDKDSSLTGNYFAPGSWISDFKMKNIRFDKQDDKFMKNSYYNCICGISTLHNTESLSSQEMSEKIFGLDGIDYIVIDYHNIEDHIVVRKMKDLYLDFEGVVSKIRRKNPDLYNAFVNDDYDEDSRAYTFAGMKLWISGKTKEQLTNNCSRLLEISKNYGFDIISFHGKQKESIYSMLPISNNTDNLRIHPTDVAIDFLPKIFLKKNESDKLSEREGY